MTVAESASSPLGLELEERLVSAPSWLAARRRAGWDAYEALPLPSAHADEDWRRTDISKLHIETFSPGTTAPSVIASLAAEIAASVPDAAMVHCSPSGIAIENADRLNAEGVIITSLADAARRHPDLLQRTLEAVGTSESKFLALWNALGEGCFVHVPHGVAASVPLWITHTAAAGAVFPATVVSVGDNATLTLVETSASPSGGAPLLSNTASIIDLGREARVDHCVIQRWSDTVWHFATHRARLAASAHLRFFGATFGARLQKAYWEALLEGPGAEADLAGVAFGDGAQHLDHQSLQAHRAPDTRSDLLLKVAVRDTARSVYSGMIEVTEAAVHANGYVANRNLILGQGATANSVPRLEIKANDVRCGHGATVGHIDDDQRFYLQSRGVSRDDADQIIVRGFLDDALLKVRHDGIRNHLAGLLEAEVAGTPQAGIVAPQSDG